MTVPSRSRKTARRIPMPLCLSIDGKCRLKTCTTKLRRGEAAGPHVALGLLERFKRSYVLTIALPQPAMHPADKRRQHVEAQVKPVHVGHLVIGRSAESINT